MNLTPNFNLIQPEATEPFEDFRAWYNQTLSIIDANLGGGGSKHTIVDENGQALPNRTYLEFTGGVQVTDDALNNKTVVDITGGGGGSSTLAGLTDVNLQTPADGQVLTYDNASQKWINANPSGGSGTDYTLTEQVIGTYFGKPLYRRSYQPTLTGQQNVISHGIADFKECVRIYGTVQYNGLNEALPLPYISINLNYVICLGNVTPTTFLVERGIGFSSLQNCVVHLEYTKTTD